MRYMLAGTAIVGYTFAADTYGPCCVLDAVKSRHPLDYPFESTLLADDNEETILNFVARQLGVNRADERSFDSGDFPKVVTALDVESSDERCGGCGEPLIGD